MFCSINLKGKKQCIYDSEGVNRSIIQSLYALLISDDLTIRLNCIETLRSIAQLKDGFLAIASEMGWENKDYLEEIFGPKVVVAMAELLPKPRSLPTPPIIEDYENINTFKEYCKTLCHFILKEEAALTIALEETVEVVLKIVPYMIFRGDKELQEACAPTILRICAADHYSVKLVRDFLQAYGKVEHPINRASLDSEFKANRALSDLLTKA